MADAVVFSIVESLSHPDFSRLFDRLGIRELKFHAMRKAIAALKKDRPDWVVAEFFYGWGNNYAGANVGNLDVFLSSLQKYAPDARVIVLVDAANAPHVAKLQARFPLHAVLRQPVTGEALAEVLEDG